MSDAAYFDALGRALRLGGYFRPTLVIDRDRLDGNVDHVRARLPADRPLRLVDKSLPVLPLLERLMAAFGTRRIMSFHLPVAAAVLQAFPNAEVLFGKPMPAAALRAFFASADGEQRQALSERVVHLADSRERIDAYRDIAGEFDLRFRLAVEVNVGLHRGGFETPRELGAALASIAGHRLVACEGLMGYEPHIVRMPGLFGGADAERARVEARLAGFLAMLGPDQRTILNTGGSKTALGYAGATCGEVSMGSAFLLPTDFDGGELSSLQPAFYIATPVLKVLDARLPGPPWLTRAMQWAGKFPRKGCYLYGGKWMAKPVFPPDLRENGLWGSSSNQQFYAIDDHSTLAVDDFAFFRPTQSEAVLQQFGPIPVYTGGRIVETWQPLPVG